MKYEYIPHTADVKFRAYGSTANEAFSNAALAMFNIMTDTEKIETVIESNISVSSESCESLLYDFLEQFLILFDSEGFTPHSVDVTKIEKKGKKYILKAKAKGDKASGKYDIKPDVKAVTYSEMKIEKPSGKKGWVLQVVCDV